MEDLSWLDETKQIHTFVKNGVRIDGRSFVDHRKVSCKVSTVHADGVVGSAQVQIGGTVVSCGINLKVGTPTADSPDAGEIVCSCVLVPGCDAHSIDQRVKSKLGYELESMVLSVVRSAGLIDLTSLSIAKGLYAYKLCVNITCLSNAGSLQDAVLFAAVAALENVQLPLPVQREDTIAVNTEVVRPLALRFACIPVTVGVVGDVLLVDPSEQEERALQGVVTCVFAMPSGALCYLRQTASARFGQAQLARAVAYCAAQAAALYARPV